MRLPGTGVTDGHDMTCVNRITVFTAEPSLQPLFIFIFLISCMCVCISIWICAFKAEVQCLRRPEGAPDSPEARVPGSCESPNVGGGNSI